jgi:hypothetical protein
MRTIDVLKKWCGITDPETLEKEVLRFETCILESAEEMAKVTGKSGIEVLPGVEKLLDSLSEDKEMRGGEEKWAICTSCKFCFQPYSNRDAEGVGVCSQAGSCSRRAGIKFAS